MLVAKGGFEPAEGLNVGKHLRGQWSLFAGLAEQGMGGDIVPP